MNDVTAQDWIAFGVFVLVGFLVGALLANLVRRLIDREGRADQVRQVAGQISRLVFWLAVVAGLLAGVRFVNPGAVEDIPDSLITYLPRAIVAAVFLILGQIVGELAGTAVGQAAQRANGRPQPVVERVVKSTIFGLFAIMALAQLGIDNTLIYIIAASVFGGLMLSIALLTGLGGREVASQIAAGRALKSQLIVGGRVANEDVSGTIVQLHATTVQLQLDDGSFLHLPYDSLFGQPFTVSAPPQQG